VLVFFSTTLVAHDNLKITCTYSATMKPQTYKTILFVVFMLIFVATAAITLLGILGIISIEKNYLDALFAALLIELVGAVIALYRSANFFKAEPEEKNDLRPTVPEPSREFFVGRWRVDQDQGDRSGGTLITYLPDGQFVGTNELFRGGIGTKEETRGKWDIQKIAANKFILTVHFDHGRKEFKKTFKIVDQNRIHNVDMNYDAVRVED
jgi:hypothetical protein